MMNDEEKQEARKRGREEERKKMEGELRQDKPWKRGNTGIYIDYRRIYV